MAFLTNTEFPVDADKFAKDLLPRVQLTAKVIGENIRKSQTENKRYYDRQTGEMNFEIGKKCWLKNMQRKVGSCPEMEQPWIGPFIVVQKGSKGNYKLRHAVTDIPLQTPVHVNRMKKYVEPYHVFHSLARVERLNRQQGSHQRQSAKDLSTTNYNNVKQNQQITRLRQDIKLTKLMRM